MSVDATGTATEAIARFVASPDNAPGAALEAARRVWLDTVLAAACGAGDRLVDDAGAVCRELLAGDGVEPAQWRAFRATLAAGAFGTHDTGDPGRARHDAAVACAAAAVADVHTTVGSLLDAVARGVEVAAAIGRAFVSARPDAPWDSGAVAARFGATAAAGRLLGLDRRTLVHAFGLAGGQAGGLRSAAGTANALVQLARGSFDGVEAVLLAQRGVTASDGIVDGAGGAGNVLYGVGDREPTLAGIGWAPAAGRRRGGTAPTRGDHDVVTRAEGLVTRGICPPELPAAIADRLDRPDAAEPVAPLLRFAATDRRSADG